MKSGDYAAITRVRETRREIVETAHVIIHEGVVDYVTDKEIAFKDGCVFNRAAFEAAIVKEKPKEKE